jgi:site-specific recombinase XerD
MYSRKVFANITYENSYSRNLFWPGSHDLRRTFVSDLLDTGADIATVAKMAGHASVSTTARYDRRPEEARRKAVGLLHVPYRRRGCGYKSGLIA